MIQHIYLLIKKQERHGMWTAGICTIFALLLSRFSFPYAETILYITAMLLAGIPVLFRAIQGLRFRIIGIECLVSIAVVGACCIGEFSEAAIVTFLFQFGTWLEQKTVKKTRSAIKALTDLSPVTAWRIEEAETGETSELVEIDADQIEEGNLLLVKTGGQIAADGTILQGEGYVNESGITGESKPCHKTEGSHVFAGTILETGTLKMRADRVGEDTTFARIITLVEEAQDAKSPAEQFIDCFARYYTPAVVILSGLVLLLTRRTETAITVLVLSCPGALVIGAPIANVAGIGKGAREGVLLKGGESIHTFAKTDTIVFDKTGTLTCGQPLVIREYCYCPELSGSVLSLAASAEQVSDHPLAKSVLTYARSKNLSFPPVTSVETLKGYGLSAKSGDHRILIGNRSLIEKNQILLPDNVRQELEYQQSQGMTTVLLAQDQELVSMLTIADAIKTDAKDCMTALKKLGIHRLILLSGDNSPTAASVSSQIGIDEYHGELLPQDKMEIIQKLQSEHHIVTFVGDGINDSPAITAADTGIAMGSGTDAAIDSSDVILIRSDLSSLIKALQLARRTRRIMLQNIAIAIGTVLLLLSGLFAGMVHMAAGMLIHEASILIVILNAMR